MCVLQSPVPSPRVCRAEPCMFAHWMDKYGPGKVLPRVGGPWGMRYELPLSSEEEVEDEDDEDDDSEEDDEEEEEAEAGEVEGGEEKGAAGGGEA
jgi:hypothetical protein